MHFQTNKMMTAQRKANKTKFACELMATEPMALPDYALAQSREIVTLLLAQTRC